MTSTANNLLPFLERVALLQDGAELTDGQLLERFFQHRQEEAFRPLLHRHGSMVLGVCRRLLRNGHDAEDAFQATFLILLRKGTALFGRQSIGNWLFGVAYHTSLKLRAMTTKRRLKEAAARPRTRVEVRSDVEEIDLRPLLDRELSQLPDKYREAVVLCELEGKSRKEAARLLGIPEGTLSSRLATARRSLAHRLARCGLGVTATMLTAALSPQPAVSAQLAPLVAQTLQAALHLSAGATAGAGMISTKVAALIEGGLRSMFLSKSTVLVLLAAMGMVLAGVALAPMALPETRAEAPAQPGANDAQKQIDKWIAQLGSSKFEDREEAARELKKLGLKAVPALKKAARSNDAEVARRAREVLETVLPAIDRFQADLIEVLVKLDPDPKDPAAAQVAMRKQFAALLATHGPKLRPEKGSKKYVSSDRALVLVIAANGTAERPTGAKAEAADNEARIVVAIAGDGHGGEDGAGAGGSARATAGAGIAIALGGRGGLGGGGGGPCWVTAKIGAIGLGGEGGKGVDGSGGGGDAGSSEDNIQAIVEAVKK
jgi:RNA polymerase sigma factor (sigma-70 family)